MFRGGGGVEQLTAIEIRFDQRCLTRFKDFPVLGSSTVIGFLRSPHHFKQLLFGPKSIIRTR